MANAALIDSEVPPLKNSDRALYSAFLGITPERLVQNGLERKIRRLDPLHESVESAEGVQAA